MNPTALNEALADRYIVEHEIGRGGMATAVPRSRSAA